MNRGEPTADPVVARASGLLPSRCPRSRPDSGCQPSSGERDAAPAEGRPARGDGLDHGHGAPAGSCASSRHRGLNQPWIVVQEISNAAASARGADPVAPANRSRRGGCLPRRLDWLPENHGVFFLLDLAAALDLGQIHAHSCQKDPRGAKACDPQTMEELPLCACCVGLPSSRHIKNACGEDAAPRC